MISSHQLPILLNLTLSSNANTACLSEFGGSGGLLEKAPRPLYDWWDAEMKGGFDVTQHSLALLNHAIQDRPTSSATLWNWLIWYSIHSRNTIVVCSLSKAKPNVLLHLLSSCTVNFKSQTAVYGEYDVFFPGLSTIPQKKHNVFLFLRTCSTQCFIGSFPSALGGPTPTFSP